MAVLLGGGWGVFAVLMRNNKGVARARYFDNLVAFSVLLMAVLLGGGWGVFAVLMRNNKGVARARYFDNLVAFAAFFPNFALVTSAPLRSQTGSYADRIRVSGLLGQLMP